MHMKHAGMIAQADTKPILLLEIIESTDFKAGFASKIRGQPPEYDRYDSWEYERGRLFACWLQAFGKRFENRKGELWAPGMLAEAFNDGAVI